MLRSDKAIGHLEGFIVDDENWALRYLVVDTRNWWFGKKVLVAPQWASTVSWNERKVYVDVSRDFVKNSPEWNTAAINREYEARLHDYHGRPGYWWVSPGPLTGSGLGDFHHPALPPAGLASFRLVACYLQELR